MLRAQVRPSRAREPRCSADRVARAEFRGVARGSTLHADKDDDEARLERGLHAANKRPQTRRTKTTARAKEKKKKRPPRRECGTHAPRARSGFFAVRGPPSRSPAAKPKAAARDDQSKRASKLVQEARARGSAARRKSERRERGTRASEHKNSGRPRGGHRNLGMAQGKARSTERFQGRVRQTRRRSKPKTRHHGQHRAGKSGKPPHGLRRGRACSRTSD